jgi:hypothetical protein
MLVLRKALAVSTAAGVVARLGHSVKEGLVVIRWFGNLYPCNVIGKRCNDCRCERLCRSVSLCNICYPCAELLAGHSEQQLTPCIG